ncbi:MAG: glycosyltransferase family 2 protein [Candidatus Roizmanbacteria bacterium]|nr:glycosyltransferase family 2 protein [Candidatus Roizmanbacteria bacterium]
MPNVSIVFPVYNEANHLVHSIRLLLNDLKKHYHKPFEVILVENGSVDESWNICRELKKKHPEIITISHLSKASYGHAISEGITLSKYENIVLFNVDFWDIPFLIQSTKLLYSCDIVVGSKTLIVSKDQRPFLRRQITYWFNVLLRAFYNFPGSDTHGIKALKKDTVLPIAKSCYPLHELYDTQLILRACRKKLIYTEIPVSVREKRPTRYSTFKRTLNLIHDLGIIFKYRYL